jgi:hypothetical protein
MIRKVLKLTPGRYVIILNLLKNLETLVRVVPPFHEGIIYELKGKANIWQ